MKIKKMEQDHINELLPEYLEGRLNSSQERAVEKHLEKCSACQKELRELKIFFETFKKEKEIEPSASLSTDFEKMLQNEKYRISGEVKSLDKSKKNRSNSTRNLLKLAAVVSLVLCSYLLGKFHQTEQDATVVTKSHEPEQQQGNMLALLNSTSASNRIKGVNYFQDSGKIDQEIIRALTDRMLNDDNSNVRLSAVQALSKFTASEKVKKSLISALKTEKDPVIQIATIQILVKIQEEKAVGPMEHLLEQDSTEPFVKEQIKSLLPSIT